MPHYALSRVKKRGPLALLLALILSLGLLAPPTQASADPGPQSRTFNYNGRPQVFEVPPGVTEVTIEAWGASSRGLGGYARGTFGVFEGEILHVFVGGQPTTLDGALGIVPPNGGWNGGGSGGLLTSSRRVQGGAGASDVRRGTGLVNSALREELGALADSRIIAAGGGGGGWGAGDGGGLVGGGGSGEGGSSLTGGGARGTWPGCSPGTSGDWFQGGDGGNDAGGGGGGYGAGGGGVCSGGGGGGASFIHPTASDPFTEAGVRTGHGRVVISWEGVEDLVDAVTGLVSLESDDEPCSDPGTRVDRVHFSNGPNEFEADVHQTDDEVITCVYAERNGDPILDEVVRVSTTPPEPGAPPLDRVDVDADAPPGNAPGSPCTENHGEGGSESTNAYARSSSTNAHPVYVCAGINAGGQSRHVRVTIS